MRSIQVYIAMSLVLSGCFLTQPDKVHTTGLKLDPKSPQNNSTGVAKVTISSISVVNNQLVINGSALEDVNKVRITGPSNFNETFPIESKTASNLIANGLKNISFAIGEVFNLIVTDAYGAATFQVTFTLQDGSVTASKLDQMGAGIGQVLKWNGTTWVASDLGGLTYAGNWDGTANSPDLTGGGNLGEYYIVNNAGTFDLAGGAGTSIWAVGDWVVWNNVLAQWEKIDNATNVTTFNGRSGAVTPQSGDYTWAQINKTTSLISDIANVNAPAGDGSDTGKVLKWNNVTSKWELADDLSGGGAGSVTSTEISNGAIVDADVNAAAAIAQSKISNLTTDLAAKVPLAGGTMTGDLTVPNIITAGNVDGVDVSALNTTVSGNTTAIAGKEPAITAAVTTTYFRGDKTFVTLDTAVVPENTNLYFTAARAKAAAVVNSTAGSETDQAASVAAMKAYVGALGSGDFESDGTVSMTGNINAGGNNIINLGAIRINDSDVNYVELKLPANIASDYSLTFPVDDGTANQVLTTDGAGVLSWGSATSGTVTSVSGTAPVSVVTGASTPVISMAQANGATDGYLDNVDWTTFNSKQSAITTGTTAQYLRGDLTLATLQDDVRSTLLTGFASSAGAVAATDTMLQAVNKLDGNIAGKEPAITAAVTTTYFRGDKTFVTLDTAVVPENTNLYFTAARAIAAPLTGFSPGAGTVAATDTVLEAIEKLDGNITAAGDILNGGNTEAATLTIGTNDANSLELETNGTTKLTILSDGQVGIGANTPSSSLEVKSNLTASLSGTVDVVSGAATVTGTATSFNTELRVGDAIKIASETFTVSAIASSTSLTLDSNHAAGATGATAFSDPSLLSLNNGDGANLLTVDKSGYLGIGASSPSEKLDINGALLLRPKGTSTGETGQASFRELATNGSDAITLRSPDALAASYNLTLPMTSGNSGEVLTTDGSGSLSWAPAEAATSVSASAGAVGTPSMSFSADSNTGFYSSGADQIGVATNGVNTFNFTTTALASPTIGGASITTGNGTAAAPTFSFAGDEDTGWFRAAANELAASTAGSQRIRIDSSGNVGIGTTGPQATLEVLDSTNYTGSTPSPSDYTMIVGSSSAGKVAIGEHNGMPSLQGMGTGSQYALYLNPAAGDVILANGGGNVGIGTTTPDRALVIGDGKVKIDKSGNAGNAADIWLDNTGLIAATGDLLLHVDADNASGGNFTVAKGSETTTGDTVLFRIQNDGDVGIGTTTPGAKLEVAGAIKAPSSGTLLFSASNESGVPTTADGFRLRYDPSYFGTGRDALVIEKTDFNANDPDGGIAFVNTGIDGSVDTALVIKGDGNVGIGTKAPSEKLHVVGNLRVQGATDCTLGGGAGATNCTSDERLKDDITPINDALEKIKSVKGVDFVWNEKALSPGMHSIGVIAQDIQKVFPTAVIENADGYLSVDYAVLVSPLIEAVKELDRNHRMFKVMQEGLSKDNSRKIASLENELTEAKFRVEQVEIENQNIKAENQEIKAENQEIKAENQEIKQQLNDIKSIVCSIKPSSIICR